MSANQKSQSYQPKKLLKLPKEMPSNIVSEFTQTAAKGYLYLKMNFSELKSSASH